MHSPHIKLRSKTVLHKWNTCSHSACLDHIKFAMTAKHIDRSTPSAAGPDRPDLKLFDHPAADRWRGTAITRHAFNRLFVATGKAEEDKQKCAIDFLWQSLVVGFDSWFPPRLSKSQSWQDHWLIVTEEKTEQKTTMHKQLSFECFRRAGRSSNVHKLGLDKKKKKKKKKKHCKLAV